MRRLGISRPKCGEAIGERRGTLSGVLNTLVSMDLCCLCRIYPDARLYGVI